MSSDRPEEPVDASDQRALLFICDASAEADQWALALKRSGYGVVDVALSMLASRVAAQRPALIVCDIDAEGAFDALQALRDVPGGAQIDVIAVGDADGNLKTLASRVSAEASASFARPVDVDELTTKVARLVGPGGRTPPRSQPTSHRPALLSPSIRPPSNRPTEAPRAPSDIPAHLQEPDPEDLMEFDRGEAPVSSPDAATSSSRPPASHLELSSEISTLLIEAERRMSAQQRQLALEDAAREDTTGEAILEPETDAGQLPMDVLEALDEPLEEDQGASVPSFQSMSDSLFAAQSHTSASLETGAGTGTMHGPELTSDGTGAGTSAGAGGATGIGTEAGIEDANSRVGAETGLSEFEDEERRGRQEAATPKPPRPPKRDQQASTVPPRSSPSPSTKPPAPIETQPPSRPGSSPPSHDGPARASLGPPATLQSDPPASAFSPFSAPALTSAMPAAGELSIRDVSSAPPPPLAGEDPSTAPPPRQLREDRILGRDSHTEGQQAGDQQPTSGLSLPDTLRQGSTVRIMADAITTRWTGGIAFEVDQGIRRVVFRDGDFVTAASGVHGESLVAFLVARGDLPAHVAREAHKLPISGRHAGAALVARGHLTQDQLWEVLRAHAEWIILQVSRIAAGSAALETELPGRLKDEPAVFGGATGAEVLVEILRRSLEPEEAAAKLGGWDMAYGPGPNARLLGECALGPEEAELAGNVKARSLRDLVEGAGDASFASAVHALVELGVLARTSHHAEPIPEEVEDGIQKLDAEALREQILARRALVQEGDYFSLLGVPRGATAYDIRRAYSTLRRDLDPSRALTPGTADLEDDLREILEVIDEAYDILKDQVRRERYRRAIGATP